MDATAQQLILQRLDALNAKVEQISKEAREDRQGIEGRLIELMTKGCAKVPLHEEVLAGQSKLSDRVRAVEQAQAEGRGKLVVAMVFITGILTAFFTWLGKHVSA